MNRTRIAPWLAGAALLAPFAAARAESGDTVNIVAGAFWFRDSNIYRLAPEVDPNSVGLAAGRSDIVRSGQLGLRLDKSWSLQRLQLNATAIDNRYANYRQLDYNATIYDGNWMWQVTPRLTGTLTAERAQSLVNYADYRNYTTRNVRVTENRHFDADWWLHGSWHLTAGLSQSRLRYDNLFAQDDANRVRSAEGGIRYVAESGSKVSLIARSGKGSYDNIAPNPITLTDNQFRRNELELRVNWQLSALSSIDASVARMRRRHATYSERDFSGTTGSLAFNWQPSGQWQLGLTASRTLGVWQDNPWLIYGSLAIYSSSYVVDDKLTFAPLWNFSAKADLRFKLDYDRRNYRGGIFTSLESRTDRRRTAMAALDWQFTRSLTLSATVQREHRGCTIAGYDYDDNSLGLTAQLQF